MEREEWLTIGLVGWQPLLRELDEQLKARWPDYTISQVKEKFGTLRFYAQPGVPAFSGDEDAYQDWYAANIAPFYELIYTYEERSGEICELCGEPGKLGSRGYWHSTRCIGCAPEGWVADDVICEHEAITDGVCDECGRTRLARLEHSDTVLYNTHPIGTCAGQTCTIHRRSNHHMRSFEQHWRADRQIMERICEHGVGHPDPDEVNAEEAIHACDGCCLR